MIFFESFRVNFIKFGEIKLEKSMYPTEVNVAIVNLGRGPKTQVEVENVLSVLRPHKLYIFKQTTGEYSPEALEKRYPGWKFDEFVEKLQKESILRMEIQVVEIESLENFEHVYATFLRKIVFRESEKEGQHSLYLIENGFPSIALAAWLTVASVYQGFKNISLQTVFGPKIYMEEAGVLESKTLEKTLEGSIIEIPRIVSLINWQEQYAYEVIMTSRCIGERRNGYFRVEEIQKTLEKMGCKDVKPQKIGLRLVPLQRYSPPFIIETGRRSYRWTEEGLKRILIPDSFDRRVCES